MKEWSLSLSHPWHTPTLLQLSHASGSPRGSVSASMQGFRGAPGNALGLINISE